MTYTEVQQMIDRIRWMGGSVSFTYPESMPQAVIIIDWGLPLQVIRKTGTMPDILVEAVDEFFQKVENSQATISSEKRNYLVRYIDPTDAQPGTPLNAIIEAFSEEEAFNCVRTKWGRVFKQSTAHLDFRDLLEIKLLPSKQAA